MKKQAPAASPDAYVSALKGWRRECVEGIRKAIRAAARVEETIKWGNILYLSNGPAFMIRAEGKRVMFGFWRGQRMRDLEPRLMPGGKYEMATITLLDGDAIAPATVRRLVRKAVALNRTLGNPAVPAKGK